MQVKTRSFRHREIVGLIILLSFSIVFSSCDSELPGKLKAQYYKIKHRIIIRPLSGETVSFLDYDLYVKDHGKGTPAVILEPGLGCPTTLYNDLQRKIAKFTRVINYDHAGIGQSTESPNPRTLPYYVSELRMLLKSKQVEPPYILVGHSLGGHIIRYYAYLYPDEVAALVFIDHPHEDWSTYIKENQPDPGRQNYLDWWNPEKSDYEGTSLVEIAEYEANCDSIRGKSLPANIPVRMFTGTRIDDLQKSFGYDSTDMAIWASMQGSLLENVTDAEQFVSAEAGHVFHRDQQELVVSQIKNLVNDINKAGKH